MREPGPTEGSPLAETDLPLPQPGPGQIRLRVRTCGVCHTDLHLVEGEISLPRLPIVPGHQIVGEVDALGEGVTGLAPGDRLGVPWLFSTCGACEYCRRGLENLCDNARFTGQHVDGGFAQFMVAPAKSAYRLPDGFPDDQAAPLLCAGIIGFRSLRLSGIQPGERLGLYGFGASAHVTIQIACHWGCEVHVFTRSEAHRRHALDLGAVWVGQAQDSPPAMLDSAITFAPAGWLVPEALRVLRKGGTLAINAIHMSPIPELAYALLYGERIIRSVANSTRQDAVDLLRLAADIPIHTEVEVHPLIEANVVLQRLKYSEVRGAAVLQIL
ncbi:zinc-dependent alcohol dehydrogenase family protein [Chloroflexota bacterium]